MSNNQNNAWRVAYRDIVQHLKDSKIPIYPDENNDVWNVNGQYIFSKIQKRLNRELKITSVNMIKDRK